MTGSSLECQYLLRDRKKEYSSAPERVSPRLGTTMDPVTLLTLYWTAGLLQAGQGFTYYPLKVAMIGDSFQMFRICALLSCVVVSWSLSVTLPRQLSTSSNRPQVLEVTSDEFRAKAPWYQCQAHLIGTLISVNSKYKVESIPRTIAGLDTDPKKTWAGGERSLRMPG